MRRTSEHWWEDEEEFDAITELVVPKRLHIAVVVDPAAGEVAAARALPDAEETAVWHSVSEDAVQAMATASGGKFASGFASVQNQSSAGALWQRLRQDGPPFFRKVRTRGYLDVLEDPAATAARVDTAAEELWRELCGQTWRVELDYGLAGAEAAPRDDLLVACTGLAAVRFLLHARLQADTAARHRGYVLVDVPGYNASEQSSAPLRSWRDLGPRLLVTLGSGAVL